MWHASIALHHRLTGPLPVARIRPAARKQLIRELRRLLRGVGASEERLEDGQVAIHLRRPLTEEEIAGLPAEWLASPAIDLA